MSRPIEREDLQHVLEHTRGLWEELRDNRVFVTGGTGFFGCWLLETFCFANDQLRLAAQMVCLTRDAAAFARKAPHLAAHAGIRLLHGDVRHFDFPAGEFSHVIHAGATSAGHVAPLEEFDTIVSGTRRVLDFAVASHAQKFLFTSSGAVYGKQPFDLTHVPETYPGAPDPCNPRVAYDEAKRTAELLCSIYHGEHGVETKIARCFAIVGPHLALDAHFAIGNFINDGLHGRAITVRGDGTPHRSYLYAADLMIWLWTILIRGRACHPYNVGSENELSINELAHRVAGCFTPVPAVRIETPPTAGKAADRHVPATSRARTELELVQRIDLITAIRKTIAWNAAERSSQTERTNT
jgi:dTDP-glucose 4,6-dehydratase